MRPIDKYKHQIQQGLIIEDNHQLAVMIHLQAVYEALLVEWKSRDGLLGVFRKPRLVTGLYVWGGVGRGKTFMMDYFYHALPFDKKMRMHFHPFMRYVHEQLKQYQGQKNPLEIVARDIAKKAMVLCFDEFVVSDITDAMLLARLLDALFQQGVCLVATSNVMPDDLYRNGLQRRSFLPAIELLKKYTEILHIQTDVDYRLRYLKDAGIFYCPDDYAADEKMEKTFSVLSHEDNVINMKEIIICDRPIPVIKEVENVVWFDFNVICHAPRSQHDYLELTQKYHIIFVSHIPKIEPLAKDTILLFIRFIDVLYDAKIKLVLSSAVPVDQIYTEGQFVFDFARTKSRLVEMQSESYLRENRKPV